MIIKPYRVRKSPLMVLTGCLIWALLVLNYERCFTPLFAMVDSAAGRVLVASAILWINVVWFYGVFHLLGVAFSLLSRPVPASLPVKPGRIAILYTTHNDFCQEAAASCLKQDYKGSALFILDDSTDEGGRARVDDFCRRNGGRCTLIRRKDRGGFKAGNLNNALEAITDSYEYFAVADADEVLPADFLSKMMPYFGLDERIGFVQANHRYDAARPTKFSSAMSGGIDLHWQLFLPARNDYGFVMFYGHGAIIRTDVWRKAGGFPAIVAEDIGFAARARELGFHGLFVKDVSAREAFPADYRGFLQREIKVVKGSLEFLFGPGRSFFRSPEVSVTEKLDLLASVSVLFLPAFFMVFLVVANVFLPLAMAARELSGAASPGAWGIFQSTEAFAAKIRELWTWDFYLLTIATILAPLFYQVKAFARSPGRMLRYAAHSTAVFLSIIPSLVWETVSYIANRRAEFRVTGDHRASAVTRCSRREWFSLGCGFVLLVFSLLAWNLALLTVALSFLLHPVLLRTEWDSARLRFAALLPFFFFLFVFGSIPLLLIGFSGMLTVIMPAHH